MICFGHKSTLLQYLTVHEELLVSCNTYSDILHDEHSYFIDAHSSAFLANIIGMRI